MCIGDEDEASAALARAASLLEGVANSPSVNSMRPDVEQRNGLLCDWMQHRQAPEGGFPDWRRARGRAHPSWSIVYD